MKSIYFILISLFAINVSFGQIEEKKVNISLGVQPCLSATVTDIKQNRVEKLWKKYFKEYAKVKRNRKAKEYYSTAVRLNSITQSEIDVYAKFEEFATGVDIHLCYDLGNGFINKQETPNEYEGAKDFTNQFRIYAKTYVLEEKVEVQEEILKDLQDDLKDSKKKNKKFHDKIDDYTKKIQEIEKEIESNVLEQEDFEKKIEEQLLKVKEAQDNLRNVGK